MLCINAEAAISMQAMDLFVMFVTGVRTLKVLIQEI